MQARAPWAALGHTACAASYFWVGCLVHDVGVLAGHAGVHQLYAP